MDLATHAPDRPARRAVAARLFLVPGALALVAVALGAGIAAADGVPFAIWVRNPAAWLLGGLAAWALSRASGRWLIRGLPLVTVLMLAATLAGAGQLGVHRWIALGPLALNVALLILPATVVAVAAWGRQDRWAWLPALAALAILAAQPDASQATAFAVALAWIALTGARGARPALLAGGILIAGAAAWLRPDPLLPVPEVEGILQLAWAIAPALAALALAVLAAFSVAPALLARSGGPDERLAAAALSLYFAVSAAMPFVGAFPVPLVGVGVSSVLGAWLGLGALAALARGEGAAPTGP